MCLWSGHQGISGSVICDSQEIFLKDVFSFSIFSFFLVVGIWMPLERPFWPKRSKPCNKKSEGARWLQLGSLTVQTHCLPNPGLITSGSLYMGYEVLLFHVIITVGFFLSRNCTEV